MSTAASRSVTLSNSHDQGTVNLRAHRRATGGKVDGRRWRGSIALIAIATCAVALRGLDVRPAGSAAGTSLDSRRAPRASTIDTIRVATFNIRGGKGRDNRRDLDRIAACLPCMHLVGLNEVHGSRLWSPDDQAKRLGERTNCSWLFAPSEQRWWRSYFGNGVLSELPVHEWRRVQLESTRGRGFRNYLLLHASCGGRTVRIAITHIDRVADRRAQLKSVIAMYLALPEPAILMGDLNTSSNDTVLAGLLAAPGVVDVLAHLPAAYQPGRRIDWILARGFRTLAAGVHDSAASDHPMFWAELQLATPTAEEPPMSHASMGKP